MFVVQICLPVLASSAKTSFCSVATNRVSPPSGPFSMNSACE
jgi:hypothetical protein